MFITKSINTFGSYLMLMGKVFARPERMRSFFKQYTKEMSQLGVDSIGIVLLISFFIGAVICIQIKLNIQTPWMPRFVTGYTTREIMLLEFSSSIMCLILAGKVGSNIASELGTMRVTQQIDALEIMGQLPHPSKNRSFGHHDTFPCHIQYCGRHYRCLCHGVVCQRHQSRRLDLRTTVQFHRVVRLVRHHQKPFLRIHHSKCLFFLRIHG